MAKHLPEVAGTIWASLAILVASLAGTIALLALWCPGVLATTHWFALPYVLMALLAFFFRRRKAQRVGALVGAVLLAVVAVLGFVDMRLPGTGLLALGGNVEAMDAVARMPALQLFICGLTLIFVSCVGKARPGQTFV